MERKWIVCVDCNTYNETEEFLAVVETKKEAELLCKAKFDMLCEDVAELEGWVEVYGASDIATVCQCDNEDDASNIFDADVIEIGEGWYLPYDALMHIRSKIDAPVSFCLCKRKV